MSKIKAIFSDINGVLFEQERRFSERYSKEFGISIDKLNAYLDHDFDLCLTGKEDLKIHLKKLIIEWNWKGSVDELLEYWFDTNVLSYQIVIDSLMSLRDRGIKIFLATQNEKYKTEKFLKLLDPLLKFDYLIATYQVGYKKTNPKYFENCLKLHNLKPKQVILIDNNPKAIASAKSIGMHAILFVDQAQAIKDLNKLMF